MWSVGRILRDEFCGQIFKIPHRVGREFGKPTEWSLLKRSGKNLTPQRLIGCVQGHLRLEDVEVLVRIGGTVVGLNG